MEFLVDPGEERDGVGGEGERDGLWFRALEEVVAEADAVEPVRAGTASALVGRVGCKGVAEGEEGLACPRGRAGENEVQVRGPAVGGVEEADCAGDREAPVAALGRVVSVAELEH